MFADAVSLAQAFTRPLIVSWATPTGECQSTVGAYIIVNDAGWILTAYHMVALLQQLDQRRQLFQAHETARAAILSNAQLSDEDRVAQLAALGAHPNDAIRSFSPWWGVDGWGLGNNSQIHAVAAADIALARLTTFDPASVPTFPAFKDPSQNIRSGTSLCRLGFPFPTVSPQYDPQNDHFTIDGQIMLFPNDGILTRVVAVQDDPNNFVGFIETSSPGLRGQSGGPIFDIHGTVWGVQSQTRHLPLGFSPQQPGGAPGAVEHQFLNVGWGTHPATIAKLLSDFNVTHTVSTY